MRMLPNRYNLKNIKRAIENPRMFIGEIGKLGESFDEKDREMLKRSGRLVVKKYWVVLNIIDSYKHNSVKIESV